MIRLPLIAALLLPIQRGVDDRPASQAATPPTTPPAVVEWIAASQLKAPKLEDLAAGFAANKDARVLIVGRAFEGTADLAQFQLKICTAVKSCDVVALDIGFSEGETLDRWLHSDQGDLAKIVATCGAFDWSRSEAQALLLSLKEREKPPTIVGIGVGAPQSACEEALVYLKKTYPEGAPRAERVLSTLRSEDRNGRPIYFMLDDNERSILRLGVEEVLSVLRDQEEILVSKSSPAAFARCQRLLRVLQHYEWTMRFERDGGDSDPRGRILCDNALEALSAKGATARLLAFVHVRDLARASDLESFASRLITMGKIRPLCIGTACGDVVCRAFDPNDHAAGPPVSRELTLAIAGATPFEVALSKADGPFLLDLHAPPHDASALEWLKRQGALRSARATCGGANEVLWDYSAAQDFDWIAWFPRVAASAR